jgi:hypothetical protein
MTIQEQWPDYCPDPDVTIDVASGVLTLGSGSVLSNYTEFDLSAPDVTASLWVNNARVRTITIASNGALSMTSAQVSQNDAVEVRFHFVSPLSLPWVSRLTWTRVLKMTVPGGTSSTNFGPGGTSMPVPDLEIAFGWQSNALRVGVKPNDADGATQALVLSTRLVGGNASTTNVNLASATQQTHDSSFTYAQALDGEAEVGLDLASATSGARQEDHVRIVFQLADSIPAWNAATVRLYHVKSGGSGLLRR